MSIRRISLSALTLALLCSCSSLNDIKKKFSKSNQEDERTEIRIVDVNGNYHPIQKHVPALNADLMARQERNKNAGVADPNKNVVEKDLMEEAVPQITKEAPVVGAVEAPIQESSDLAATENESAQSTTPTTEQKNAFGADLGPSSEPLIESETSKKKAEVRYNLTKAPSSGGVANEQNAEIATSEDIPTQKTYKTANQKSAKGTFVQIGYYASKDGADLTLSQGQNFANGLVKEIESNGKIIYKVLLGPVKDDNEAKILLNKARNKGFKDAFISKIK